MEREVFILPNGDSFSAWNVKFTAPERRKESRPCNYQQEDGSMRKGVMHYTAESAEVSFCSCPNWVRVGMQGQLSSPKDIFFEVTISSLQPADNHVLVAGQATRMLDLETDR
jgi:hypothetical protein